MDQIRDVFSAIGYARGERETAREFALGVEPYVGGGFVTSCLVIGPEYGQRGGNERRAHYYQSCVEPHKPGIYHFAAPKHGWL